MDLILAHKRAMKLCELTGFSLIVQTSVATAVSEIARCAIDFGKNAKMVLGIDQDRGKKYLKAVISDTADFHSRCVEAATYARKLVNELDITRGKDVTITLKHYLNFSGTLTDAKIESFVQYFKSEPALSAYDEIRKKNLMLQDFAEQIRESESNYRTLTDTLPLMMFSANSRGVISYSNKWLQDFLGAQPKDLSSSSWQTVIHPQDFAAFKKDVDMATTRQSSFNGQYRFKNKTLNVFNWHLMSVVFQKNEKEVVTGVTGFIVDIQAQKIAEQASKDNQELKLVQQQLFENQESLERKIVELNRSNYELEQFAHLASHDLQEPLRKILFFSDSLRTRYQHQVGDRASAMLENMCSAANRMKELIQDLLSYSQLQQQKLVFEVVNLNQIIEEVMKDFDVVIRDKKATIKTDQFQPITGNTMRLRQLVGNLISNSLKYSKPDHPPEVTIKARQQNGNMIIEFRDNGIGFEESYAEKIFGLFERLHTRDQIPGTGIGLSICKRIVELHKGTIIARSVPGEYALFEIILPLDQVIPQTTNE